MRTHFKLLTFLILTSSISCSFGNNLGQVEREIPNFHQALDNGKFGDLYDKGSSDLKKNTSREEFIAYLSAVHRKLGKVKASKAGALNVDYQPLGTYVTVDYETEFTDGKGTEKFIFTIVGTQTYLNSYSINSNALVIN